MTLSKEYSVKIEFFVSYINFPKDKVISQKLPKSINIIIRSKGFNLIAYQFFKTKETIQIDLKDAKSFKSKNNFFLLTNSSIDKIATQFSSNIALVKINPDTIYFTFNKKISKRVPVKVKQNITFEDEYQLSDSIKISPDFIKISGAAEVINKIKFVETNPLVLNDIDKSTKVKLVIQKKEGMEFVEISQPEVEATVTIAKYTEASIDLPIQIENLPSKYNLKIFPDKVNVKYQVSFDNYEKLTPSVFKAVVDYKKIEKGSNKLKVQLVKVPKYIKSIKISPEKVEYILRK